MSATYVGIASDVLLPLKQMIDDQLAIRTFEYDRMKERAAVNPTSELFADQVIVAARRLAEARMVSRELDAAVPAAPIPF